MIWTDFFYMIREWEEDHWQWHCEWEEQQEVEGGAHLALNRALDRGIVQPVLISMDAKSKLASDLSKVLHGDKSSQEPDRSSVVLPREEASAALRRTENRLAKALARLLDDPDSRSERWYIHTSGDGVAYIEWYQGKPYSYLLLFEGTSGLDEYSWQEFEDCEPEPETDETE